MLKCASMLSYVEKVIFRPKLAWERLKEEKLSTPRIIFTYAILVALIPALSHFMAYGLIGLRLGITGYSRMPVFWALLNSVLIYAATLASLLITGILAHYFSHEYQLGGGMEAAIKLSVFGLTPALLAWIFQVLPALSILSYLAFYSAYVMLQGILAMYKGSSEKMTTFAVLIITCALVLQLFIFHLSDFLANRWIIPEFMTY